MDSGNSASLQSSSGGDDNNNQEYDSSRAAVDHNHNSFSSSQLPPQNNMFDPFANYFNPINISRPQQFQNYQSSLVNLDLDNWSKTLRSEPFGQSSGISFPSAPAAEYGSDSNVTVTAPAAETVGAKRPPQQQDQQPVRNPKKRSRASRRAPTTVLTTDTTNFRAMVQEFTGIPSPPFTSSSYFPRTRLDIFANTPNYNSSIRSATPNSNNPLNITSQPPNYLRRPFPQKIQPPTGHAPFLSPNSSSSSSLLSCLASNSTTISASSNSTVNYQLMMSSELGLLKPEQLSSGVANSVTTQSSNIFTQNSILTSLLQSSQEKYPLGSKEPSFEIPSNNSQQLKMGNNSVLEEYGMSSSQHGHLSGLPNLVSPEQAASRNESHINKVQETVGSRGEGMVESWICSSD